MNRQRRVFWIAWCVILAGLTAGTGCGDLSRAAAGQDMFGKLPLNKAELRMAE